MSLSSLEEFAQAIERDDLSMVESLISGGAVNVNARLPYGHRPPALVHAAGRGQKEIVDILLRSGARVNETDESGSTACHVAALGNYHDVLALLLARQPNLAVVDAEGTTAFGSAVQVCTSDDGRCALMLLEAGASIGELVDLCRFAATGTGAIQALIDRGFVLRELHYFGDTPLHAAVELCYDAALFDML